MKLLVTGASGFVGRAFCERIAADDDVELVATARSSAALTSHAAAVSRKDLAPDTDWTEVLGGVDAVVHTAARVHQTTGSGGYAEYLRINVAGTINLARQAAGCGVKRFVFLSSAKVNGECSLPGRPFRADDRPGPRDAYARSKHQAEQDLSQLGARSGMQVVTVRPPLVYGPGVKANFAALMRWIHRGYPVPFARVDNRRSFIAVDNLVDLLATCCTHPAAADQTFMASDGEDISTPDLVRRLAAALERPARLLPVPPGLLQSVAKICGKHTQLQKMTANLQVDAGKTRERLGWRPIVGMDQALQMTAQWFLEELR